MFRNYFKLTIRNLFREKLYSGINIFSLSLGAAVAILMFLYVRDEWTFDTFHAQHERIYRVWVKEHLEGKEYFNTVTPFVMRPTLENNFPDIESVVQFMTINNLMRKGSFSDQEQIHVATPSFLKVFDFSLEAGNPEAALDDPGDIVLTEALARKYFGDTSPLGKAIDLQIGGQWQQFQVSGIIEEAPGNSSIQYGAIISFEITSTLFSEGMRSSWTNVYPETYVLLREGVNPDALRAKVQPFLDKIVPEGYDPGDYEVGFQPLADIHLNNEFPQGIAQVSDWRYPYILSAIALLVLLLASINYITLAVGRSVSRAKEVGVRKVTGATRRQLMLQFWSEATMVGLIAVSIGVLLAELALPAFNQLAEKSLEIHYGLAGLGILLLLALLLGGIAGVYPALVLSGFSPVKTLRGTISKLGQSKHLVLRSLVGSQFVLSVGLIICTFIMQQQMSYLQDKNLGFDQDQLIVIPYNAQPTQELGLLDIYEDGRQKATLLRQELAGNPGVQVVATATHALGTPGWMQLGYDDPATKQFHRFRVQGMDEHFLPATGIALQAGRNFSEDAGTDDKAVIINQAMAKEYDWEKYLDQPLPPPFQEYRLIGITENFHFASLHTEIEPLMMLINPFALFRIVGDVNFNDFPTPKLTIKLAGGKIPSTLKTIEQAWKSVAPEQAFNFEFVDDALQAQYLSERRLSEVISLATLLAILVAGLGLFGIATLTAARRTKEIGVRKVLGASMLDIVLLLNRSFTVLVIAASIIAAPLAWYLMSQWLSDFAYRISINPLVIALAILSAILIAWLAVSYQSLRVARRNPVEALRYE